MSGDREQVWAAVKAAWSRGDGHALTPKSFAELFYSRTIGAEAIALMKSSAAARSDLLRIAGQMSAANLTDSDVRRVWVAAQGEVDFDDLLLAMRSGETPAIRRNFVSSIVESLLDVKGRQWMRSKLAHWWASGDLLEEEQDAIIRKMIDGGITDIATYRRLGPQATWLAETALNRSGLVIVGSVGSSLKVRRTKKRGRRSEVVAGRVESLVTHVVLPIDIRDACIEADELARLEVAGSGLGQGWSLLARALERAMRRHGGPMLWELNELLSRRAVATPRAVAKGARPSWSVPLLRLLHLQQVLEAPSLSTTVTEPEVVLVPDVVLYLIGRDAVSYTPELRVHRDTGSRWRARWAESAAEAATCAFLEDSVQLDLATLSRIPEVKDGPTPDFMATSVGGEAFVFEVKGGTAWTSHIKQRREAIKQLGKDGRRRLTRWAGDGRAFACSLYAAKQGDSRSSLFHIDDPEFFVWRSLRRGRRVSERSPPLCGRPGVSPPSGPRRRSGEAQAIRAAREPSGEPHVRDSGA